MSSPLDNRTLAETTFVVVDLETTGWSPASGAAITEIGAVKVSGGKVIAEFQSLINPGSPIPELITNITGISDAMVMKSPWIHEVVPIFLEFCGSPDETVLVAHNAPFDMSFLLAAVSAAAFEWPEFPVIDTAYLARKILTKDDVPNNKLETLAAYYGTNSQPNHRALDDSRATVDVLHGLFERLGSFSVTTLAELLDF
ncbi:MAG: DNA polymerase III subunit epsilon [Actinobacteria bacterium]|jgi:DNA polymerase III epsilon subunit family exonuclease|nr:DNA polymerase III subunit epsilon [Actinomycetota bacterium]